MRQMIRRVVAMVAALLVLGACGEDDAAPTSTTSEVGVVTITSEFENGSDGWSADVSDFSDETRPDEVVIETGASPPGLEDVSSTGFFHLAATNRSDDLFMYLRRQVIEDLVPDTDYEVSFIVQFASNAPSGCVGVGGAPGESVWLKVGASSEEPIPVVEDGEVRLSVDKGNQAQGGRSADIAGDIANGIPCEDALEFEDAPYALVSRQETMDELVTSTPDGTLWLFVGTDSGFESRTSLYYDRIEVTLLPVP